MGKANRAAAIGSFFSKLLSKLGTKAPENAQPAFKKTAGAIKNFILKGDTGVIEAVDDVAKATKFIDKQLFESELKFISKKNIGTKNIRAISDKASQRASALMETLASTKSDRGKIAQKKKLLNIMGLDEDSLRLTDSKFKEALKNKASNQIHDKVNVELSSELHGYIGDEALLAKYKKLGINISENPEVNNIQFAKLTIDQKTELNKELFNGLVAARSVAWKELKDDLSLGWAFNLTSTVEDKLNALYSSLIKDNNPNSAEKVREMYHFMQGLKSFDAQLSNFKINIKNEFTRIGDEKTRAIRTYIENFDTTKVKTGNFKDGPLAAQLNLSDEEVGLANKIVNFFRLAKEKEFNIHNKKFDVDMSFSFDDLPTADIVKKGQRYNIDGLGDLGENYYPIVITDEYKDIIKTKKDVRSFFDEIKGEYQKTYYDFHIPRRVDSGASLSQNRKSPLEEIEAYIGRYKSSSIKIAGSKILDEVKQSLSLTDLIGKTKNDIPVIKRYMTLTDSIDSHWKNIFSPIDTPEGFLGKTVSVLTDMNTAMALASPRMVLFNTLQSITNTAMWKGVGNTLNSYKIVPEFIGGFIKEGKKQKGTNIWRKVFNERNIQGSIKALKDSKVLDPEIRTAINHYFTHSNPDILMKDFYHMDAKWKEAFNIITMPFKMSDITSRSVSAAAAGKFAQQKLKLFGNDLFTINKKTPETLNRLIKELHLNEFNALERNTLFNLAKKQNGRQEFINQFVDLSVKKEIYDYSRYNRQAFLDFSRKNFFAARAARFLSWNLYYTNILGGAYRSYINGDKKPLKDLAKIALVWGAGMGAVSGTDFPVVSDYARYGFGRTPGIMPTIGLSTLGFRQAYGITTPAISDLVYIPIKTVDWINDNVFRGSQKDSIDFLENFTWQQVKNQPLAKPFKVIKDLGLID